MCFPAPGLSPPWEPAAQGKHGYHSTPLCPKFPGAPSASVGGGCLPQSNTAWDWVGRSVETWGFSINKSTSLNLYATFFNISHLGNKGNLFISLLPDSFVLFLNWLRTQAGESGSGHWVPRCPLGAQGWTKEETRWRSVPGMPDVRPIVLNLLGSHTLIWGSDKSCENSPLLKDQNYLVFFF